MIFNEERKKQRLDDHLTRIGFYLDDEVGLLSSINETLESNLRKLQTYLINAKEKKDIPSSEFNRTKRYFLKNPLNTINCTDYCPDMITFIEEHYSHLLKKPKDSKSQKAYALNSRILST